MSLLGSGVEPEVRAVPLAQDILGSCIASRVECKDSIVLEVAVCPRTTQRVAVRLDGCREVGRPT